MSGRCNGRFTVQEASSPLACDREMGHEGIHLAPIILNGERCETGWRDSDAGAWLAPFAPAAAPQGDSE